MAVAAHETMSSGALSPGTPNYQQSSTPSSPWRFSYPPATLDDEAEESNSGCTPQENGVPAEKANTGSPPQAAITGGIPCYFEEFRYSSHPPAPPRCTSAGMEQVIKKDKLEVTEPEQSSSWVSEQSSSQVILVSRILKGIPQSPHFLPLKGYSDVAKHSLINAWDCIFEEVVDQIQSMQVNGFWVNAKRLWQTMGELQNMGYNVIAVRRRLVELTDVVLRIRRHRSDIRELKSKAEEHRAAKSRLEFEIMKLRDRVEAEKARLKEVMVKVKKMEQKVSQFDDVLSTMATQKIKIC